MSKGGMVCLSWVGHIGGSQYVSVHVEMCRGGLRHVKKG